MGLDDFIDEASSNKSNTSTNNSTEQSISHNTSTEAEQLFSDIHGITPRSIKYQIKTIGAKWVYQFSTKRFDNGELIMYSAGDKASMHGKTVVVFTTIQSVTDSISTTDNKDIHIVPYDVENKEQLDDPTIVEPSQNWNMELIEKIEEQMSELEQYIN